jgi:hypothetical protein
MLRVALAFAFRIVAFSMATQLAKVRYDGHRRSVADHGQSVSTSVE